jgi:hypothetical protein
MHSLANSGSSRLQMDGVLSAIETLAYAHRFYDQDGSAAQNAVKAFTGEYEFLPNGGARIPRKQFDAVTANIRPVLDRITKDNIAIPASVTSTPEQERRQPGISTAADYVDDLKSSPEWVNSPKGDALWLRDSRGRIVLNKNGTPVNIPFSVQTPMAPGMPRVPAEALVH